MTTTTKRPPTDWLDANAIRLPVRFIQDHMERDLPTPVIVHRTKRHVWVAAMDAALPELLDDARYYAGEWRHMHEDVRPIGLSAEATVRAIEEAVPGFKDDPNPYADGAAIASAGTRAETPAAAGDDRMHDAVAAVVRMIGEGYREAEIVGAIRAAWMTGAAREPVERGDLGALQAWRNARGPDAGDLIMAAEDHAMQRSELARLLR